MNLALFDFDGTITFKDTFTDFIYFTVNHKRLISGLILMAPVFFGYKLGILSPSKTRQIVARFAFNGCSLTLIQAIGMKYADQVMPQYIKPEASKKIQWHKSQGDKIVVVSASLDIYLKPWCNKNELELICTGFEVVNGFISGKYFGGDCSGIEKAKRIRESYNIKDYKTIYAYGDTSEDKEMLDLADKKYFRWKQIS
jgi:phosphatidylglycerophosphatase C